MEVKLSKPFTVAPAAAAAGDRPASPAKAIEKIVLQLDGLTGADVELCAREAQLASGGVPIGVLVLDHGFHVQVAARASEFDVAVLRRLPARDYLAVTQAVQGFLTGSD